MTDNSTLIIFGDLKIENINMQIPINLDVIKFPILNFNNYSSSISVLNFLLDFQNTDSQEMDNRPFCITPRNTLFQNTEHFFLEYFSVFCYFEDKNNKIEYDVSVLNYMMFFRLKDNVVFDSSLPDFTKVEINGTTYWSASTEYMLSSCFSINHFALTEYISFEKLHFSDITSRQITNTGTQYIDINCKGKNISILDGNFRVYGIDTATNIISGTVEFASECEMNQINVFPRGTAILNDNSVASSAISLFNPTGAGRFIFPKKYLPGVFVVHTNEQEMSSLPDELNFEVVRCEDGGSTTLILIDNQVMYRDEVYKVALNEGYIKLRLSNATIDNICIVPKSSMYPEGSYAVDSIEGFSGMSVLYASGDFSVNLDILKMPFSINGIDELRLSTFGRGTGAEMTLSGVVNYVSGNVDSIIVEPFSNIQFSQSRFLKLRVNYDGKDKTQALFSTFPSIEEGIFLKKQKMDREKERGNMITVALKGNYSEEELKPLGRLIRSGKEYHQYRDISGFRGVEKGLSWEAILGIVIGCVIGI